MQGETESSRRDRTGTSGTVDRRSQSTRRHPEVRLSYRKATFSRIKPLNQERTEGSIADGKVRSLPETNITGITPDAVTYRNGGEAEYTLTNDYVFIFTGGTLPTRMLQDLDIQIDTKFASR